MLTMIQILANAHAMLHSGDRVARRAGMWAENHVKVLDPATGRIYTVSEVTHDGAYLVLILGC